MASTRFVADRTEAVTGGARMARSDFTALLLTDDEVDSLAWKFLQCDYAGTRYMDWSLDERLTGFLRREGLRRVADDGDTYAALLDRVMTYIPLLGNGAGRRRNRVPNSTQATVDGEARNGIVGIKR